MTEGLEATEVQVETPPEVQAEVAPTDEMQVPMYNKIQMQDVVKREKQKAYDKGRREAMAELEGVQAEVKQPDASKSLGGMAQVSQDQIDKMIAERVPQYLQDHVQQLQTKQIVDTFVSKIEAAEAKHPGLHAKLSELDYKSIAPLVELANSVPNTGDVMKELVDNPMKMGSLLALLYSQPKLAQREMASLSGSIAQNEQAKAQEAQANEPMSQMKPSTNAGMDNGKLSIADYRKMFRV